MLQNLKRICALCLALVLVLAAVPLAVAADEEGCTPVESKLDFTSMNRISEGRNETKDAENKAKVRDTLLAAGAVECDNLYLAGNFETIVNPGGYKYMGYYVQKVTAVEGETLQNATLELGYWICNVNTSDATAEQGYVEVYVSADNVNYEKVWEDREGNGPAFENSRKGATIELPLAEGQTEVYVKVCMEHWNTYEGAGVAFSNLTANVIEKPIESDKKPHECTMVTESHNFNNLTQGEVTAEDLGAVAESNMYFGIDGVTLLSPRNGYEIASATWLLEAAEGEPLHDAVLTIVGRTWWISESVRNDNYLKVYASVDGVVFTELQEFRATDNDDDTQRFTVDLTGVCAGYGRVYVKLEWLVFDSPHIFGIRSVSITGNTAGIDTSGDGPVRMAVTNVQSYTELPVGEVSKETLNAYKSANLFFGYNKTPLLTATEAGEDAYVTWKLTAPEGENFVDCHLTLVGRFGYVNADKKDSSVMKIAYSLDGESYSVIHEIKPTEDQSDTQQIVVDLSDQTYGVSEVYVRVYWSSKDDPSAMGLRSASLVANAGADYALYTPELKDRVITDEEWAPFAPQDPETPTEPETPADPSDPTENNAPDANTAEPRDNSLVWIIVAVAAVAVIVVVCIVLKKKKTGDGK